MPTATNDLLTALIYARVSDDPRGRGRSTGEQVDESTTWCEREGIRVGKVVVDNDRSASRHAKRKREGWAEVTELLATGDYDVLVTWEASRAQRDLDAYTDLRTLCSRHGVRWAYSGTMYDLNDRSDRFRTGLDALVAEDESERTRERVLRAMRANADQGRPHGRLPFGYTRVYDERTRELVGQVEHAEQGPLVREAAARLLAGESARSIANDWNARGVPSPYAARQVDRGDEVSVERGWQLTQIRRIVTNPAVVARRVHRGEVVGAGNWPAILDDDTYDRLEAKFADLSRRQTRQTIGAHLLTGVARCGVCGGPMVHSKLGMTRQQRGRHAERHAYQCRYKHCVAREANALELYVTAWLLRRLARPDALAPFATDGGALAAGARAEVVTLTARLDDAIATFNAGEITGTTLGRIESELRARIAEATRLARPTAVPTIAADIVASADPAAMWDGYSVEQRRELLRALVDLTVLPVKVRGSRHFDDATVDVTWRVV